MMESHHKTHDGRRLLILGSYMDAIKTFTEVISIHPGLPSAWRYIAEAYRRLGEKEKADAALKEAEAIEKSKDQEVVQTIDVMKELSRQELEILKLLVIPGVSNQTVASSMQISENSSRVQISRILESLDSPGRNFLVYFAEKHGIFFSASSDDANRRSHAWGSSYEPLPANVRLERLIGSSQQPPAKAGGLWLQTGAS
jgi:tetratricopeptide (TPR) repeat protein